MIDDRKIFDQLVKNDRRTYEIGTGSNIQIEK